MDQSGIPVRYLELASKWKQKTISPEEAREFADWYNQEQDKEILIPADFAGSDQDLESSMLQNILYITHPQRKTYQLPRLVAIAASLLLVLGVGLWYNGKVNNSFSARMHQDLAPGKDGAILTLSSGRKIRITDVAKGNLADESGVTISKNNDGQIIYTVNERNGQGNGAINTLQTSRGEQIQIRLPDSTIVFLNAASSLKYPSSFHGLAKRNVELSGEGFFQVHKDKAHPFIVKSRQQEVQVLGTVFNISSYADDAIAKTTLLEGSVRVSDQNKDSKILKPNQQAINMGSSIQVVNVEAQLVVDWKEGFFLFNHESLEHLMKRVSRWYNVEVRYQNPALKNEPISGTISKYKQLSSLLLELEKSGIAEFQLDKHILTISEKK